MAYHSAVSDASSSALEVASMNSAAQKTQRSLAGSRKGHRQEKPTKPTRKQAIEASAFSLTKSPLARPALRPYEVLVTRRLPLVVYFKRCMRLLHAGLEPPHKHTSSFLTGSKDAQFQKQLAPQFPFIVIRGAGGCMRTAIWLAQDVMKALGGLGRSAAVESSSSCCNNSLQISGHAPSLEIETHTVECTDTAWTFVEEEDDDSCPVAGTFDLAVRRRCISAISIKVHRPLPQQLS
ncbi:UNVERIFIED_CONTAM: hypothetical protein HHA_245520 [Hammondia hammondi]|eukprot:XP_008883655.1 hypothetical protein HHA_245520 [Hammondia hammondi]